MSGLGLGGKNGQRKKESTTIIKAKEKANALIFVLFKKKPPLDLC
jgi:hypothetical protein